LSYALDTLANLHNLWRRPIHIETVLDGTRTILSFDGSEHSTQKCGEEDHDA
jgi:stage V sporulation protein R